MKTKVIAFRVTQDEYDALVWVANSAGVKSVGSWVHSGVFDDITEGMQALAKDRKRLEAKAKREAKKAAANGAQ